MRTRIFLSFFTFFLCGCSVQFVDDLDRPPSYIYTKIIKIYENSTIPANTGISTKDYIKVDGYCYANIFVEFEQESVGEKPISLGVVFASDESGAIGARRYFSPRNLEKPIFINASGLESWHGSQWKKSSYIFRIPVMGPYLKVFPFNHHDKQRKFSVIIYLTQ